jgi:hypothetical protein
MIGNGDYTSWFEGDRLLFSKDADLILDAFDEACHKAGAEKCDLWAPSPEEVRGRRDNVLESLKKTPVVVPAWADDTGPELPMIVTFSKLKRLTGEIAYAPLTVVEKMASIYAALERGDGLPFYRFRTRITPKDDTMCSIGDTPATMPHETGMEEDAFPAITCADSVPVNMTPEEAEEYAEKLQQVSKYTGSVAIEFHLPCVGRTIRPKWRAHPKSKSGVRVSHRKIHWLTAFLSQRTTEPSWKHRFCLSTISLIMSRH